ncbi:hypothetical protein CBR_g22218 [Chara braunii]|uniref:Uncharacterized protein n=1 Tax=Chara braunii TaxID=69332 RepID=A0A388L2C9_CHABU|nr:hypothetical protein CBR_g22218 [Chara braunii]|eukprot:GBG76470.1 hypothetical protein CBR_g22218 [Chara braunii]
MEVKEREKAEQEKAERKARKKLEKASREAQLEAERRAELRRDNDIHLAIRLSKMEENFSFKMQCVIEPLKELIRKGKKKATYASGSDSDADEASDTSLPPKRAPKQGALRPSALTGRLPRSKKTVKSPGSTKRKTPVKTPLAKILRTPSKAATPMTRALKRLRFRDLVLKDLKNLDATELQRICKEEGVPYDGMLFPRSDEHVRFRISELEGTHPLLHNARNVPKVVRSDRLVLLKHEIEDDFRNWQNWNGDLPCFSADNLQGCMTAVSNVSDSYLSSQIVCDLRVKLRGLVLSPLDRSPGETITMCPLLYYNAMMSTFVLNSGYRIMHVSDREILGEIKEDVERKGLAKFARWDKAGEFGSAYVLPKHKDLDRYRPICPTFKEPMVRTGRVVSCAELSFAVLAKEVAL